LTAPPDGFATVDSGDVQDLAGQPQSSFISSFSVAGPTSGVANDDNENIGDDGGGNEGGGEGEGGEGEGGEGKGQGGEGNGEGGVGNGVGAALDGREIYQLGRILDSGRLDDAAKLARLKTFRDKLVSARKG
jgi:hypothetical protein